MEQLNAICLRCGEDKQAATELCRFCSFEPREEEELAQSMYLSRMLEVLHDLPAAENEPKFMPGLDIDEHLRSAQQTIKSRRKISFDPKALQACREGARVMKTLPRWLPLMVWFVLLCVLLAIVFLVWWLVTR